MMLLVTALLVFALTAGSGGIEPTSLLHALAPDATVSERLVFEWRASRALAAALFGACLAIGGTVFQTLTRNPLGSPDIIGLSAGSYAGVIIVIILGGSGFLPFAAGAVSGGIVAAAFVYLLAFQRGIHGFRLIVVGLALGAILRALTSWFSIKADLDAALQAAIWDAGSLSGMTWPLLALSTVVAMTLMFTLPAAFRLLPLIELGDEAASSLGVRVERSKLLLIFIGVGFTAVVTAATGPISFIALASPQIARRLCGGTAPANMLASGLVGAVLLSSADLIAQHLVPGVHLPVGGVTVVIGGLYLVWLITREGKRT
ncbi:iron chelate uptake ABC transporter family permease subunit [Pseudoclavibacter sp. AY1H1]|uniref:FecCD family ABC transporter permease n=1 Tax=Pseudoclavibacter sp. AY1H1 TaxID=2080584 RepID=UPI000CE82563|nr:iron chelate uptake ABC transporter family permease subunit [Pseudoclavibacter sp. AY1H1]PPF38713.1 iron-enterobactin ABC transporter permease [Pseudoclavibacter sp. AY1H1]